ncbi:MAG: PAS domain-containing protein, partial [Ignavibacteria bacterium]|nr:PAS domain-containing protein [Ignavibacteria bacterium]
MKTGKEINNVVMGVFNRQDSAYRWIKIDAVPVFRSGETHPYQVFTTFDDITERKQAEKILKENEINYKSQANFLDTIIENSPFAMWISDANGYLIRVNQVLRDTLEIPADLDITKYNILEDENFSNQGLTYILDDVFKNHKSSRFEMFWLGPETGENNLSVPKKLWVYGSMFPITDQNGKLINVIFQYTDITARKLAENAIIKHSELLAKAQEIGKIGTWELDIKNNVLSWIQESYQIFEIKSGTPMTYELFLDLIHPDDKDYVNNAWQAGLEANEYDIEHRIIVNDKVRWVREKAEISYDENNEPVKAIGLIQDITDFKRINYELTRQVEFINTMTENQPAGIVACDAEGKLVLFNKAAKEWHGIDVMKIQQD